MKVSEIFEEEPRHWGLRGDPFLWRELKEIFKEIDMPDTPQELQVLIEKEYEKWLRCKQLTRMSLFCHSTF
jgi:hypothetical protein